MNSTTKDRTLGATAEAQARASGRHRFLLCTPEHYRVAYSINPWMEGNEGRTSLAEARSQWYAFRDVLGRHADLAEMAGQPDVPDLVFTANAGLICGDQAVLSSFRYPQRRAEREYNRAWLEANGFRVHTLPEGVFFEGTGDGLLDRGSRRLWLGYGLRTHLEAAEHLARLLGIEVVPLRLVDKRFYHLDTCFAPLTGGYLIYYPDAFDTHAQRQIRELVPAARRFAVSERDAMSFACNLVDTGDAIVLHDCSAELERVLNGWGFQVVRTPLDQFLMAGGSASCLTLRLDETHFAETAPAAPAAAAGPLLHREVTIEGDLLDTGLLARIMDLIVEGGGAFELNEMHAGVRREDTSSARLTVTAPDEGSLRTILGQLIDLGAVAAAEDETPARLVEVAHDGVAPEGVYCTTIYPTDVRVDGQWLRARGQRMDGVLLVDTKGPEPKARVRLMRDLRRGDRVVVGLEGIRIHARTSHEAHHENEFQFMSSEVSSERHVDVAVDQIAWEMNRIRQRNGRIALVPGPVVVHTGGVPHMCELVRMGYVQTVLAGNAVAVHDIERAFYGTSLGIDCRRGVTVQGGHRHHLMAINRIRGCGGIAQAVAQGILGEGFMYELVRHSVPFCLAGSIRDDGPLPETEMDLERAQAKYMELLEGVDLILMLSSMLHSIAVGNMTPAGVKMVCIDINPAVATKLADRGSVESTAVVTDVGLFLSLLAGKLKHMSEPVAEATK